MRSAPPVGEATTGSAPAMYWRTLSPHFPFAHSFMGSGMTPISALASAPASVSSLQGTTSAPGMDRAAAGAPTTRSANRLRLAASRIAPPHSSRKRPASGVPIQTTIGAAPARAPAASRTARRAASYLAGSTTVGKKSVRSFQREAYAARYSFPASTTVARASASGILPPRRRRTRGFPDRSYLRWIASSMS